MKGAVYKSWELPVESSYVKVAIEYKKLYGKKCQEAKGTSARVGHVKNYVLAAMFMGYKKDAGNEDRKKERMEQIVGTQLRDDEGQLNIDKAIKLEKLVAHCQVIPGKKKSYVNMLMRDGEGKEVEELLSEVFEKEGKRQWDPPPSRAVQRELKEALQKARRAS